MGWEEYHIVSGPHLHNPMQIGCNIIVLTLRSATVFAGYIIGYEQSLTPCIKDRLRIDLIIPLFCSKKLLIILDRKQRCRKQHAAPSTHHAFFEILRRVHVKQLQFKAIICRILGINFIMTV